MIVPDRLGSSAGELGSCRVLETADPRAAIAKVLGLIQALGRQPPWVGAREISPGASISPLAVVEGHVTIGEGVQIEPFCTVGPDVSIGRGSVIRSGARIDPRVSIGEECSVGPNAVVGNDGFGFVRDEDGNKTRMPHLAGVLIGSHVEIGALTRHRGRSDHAHPDRGSRQGRPAAGVGHGADVGRGASVAAGSILGGSSVVGEEAWIGLNASIRDGRRVGSRALVGMDASVQQDLADDAIARAPRPDVEARPADDDRSAIGFPKRR